VQPSWSEGGTTRHNVGRGPSNDYFIKVPTKMATKLKVEKRGMKILKNLLL
jgi:hypothetical protein